VAEKTDTEKSPWPTLPSGLEWRPVFRNATWMVPLLVCAGIATLACLAWAVLVYYGRSETGTGVAGINFAVVLMVAGFGLVLLGVILIAGEVLMIVRATPPQPAAAPVERAVADEATSLTAVVTALAQAARGLTPGRLLIVMGVLVLVLSAWVAQSASAAAPTTTPSAGPSASGGPSGPSGAIAGTTGKSPTPVRSTP
jgi:hypothetical protein